MVKRKKSLIKAKAAKPAKKAVIAKKTNKKNPAKVKKATSAKPIKRNTKLTRVEKVKQIKKVKKVKKTMPLTKKASRKNPQTKVKSSRVEKAPPVKKTLKEAPAVKEKLEEYMNPKQQRYFRELLLAEKRELLEKTERTVHHMQDEAANFPDPNDRATQEEEFSLELRTRDRERKLIRKIEEALQRLDSHDYGYCENCGVQIGAKRLEARPTATLCIDCKMIDEIREKHFG